MEISQEKIDTLKLREVSREIKSFLFKTQPKPGIVEFVNIHLGRRYKINRPGTKVNGRIIEVVGFIFSMKSDVKNSDAIGIKIKFIDNNRFGTYYDMGDLIEI